MHKLKKVILADADRAQRGIIKAAAEVRKCETPSLGALALKRMMNFEKQHRECMDQLAALLRAEQLGKIK